MAPGDQLAPGWLCDHHATHGWVFSRHGRFGREVYQCHPLIMAQVCSIKDPDHYLYADALAMVDGRWFPEEERLRIFEAALLQSKELAQWAFDELSRDLEILRLDINAIPHGYALSTRGPTCTHYFHRLP